MAGITTGDRLAQLEQLRDRIDHEIQVEKLRIATDGGRHRDTPPTTRTAYDPTGKSPEQIAEDHGVTSKDIRTWALNTGLIDTVKRGRLPLELALAYAAEHRPTSTTNLDRSVTA